MAKVTSFLGTMPNAYVLRDFMTICCKRFVPFHYDPATKVFSAYPICQEDLDELLVIYQFHTNGLFNPNSNR